MSAVMTKVQCYIQHHAWQLNALLLGAMEAWGGEWRSGTTGWALVSSPSTRSLTPISASSLSLPQLFSRPLASSEEGTISPLGSFIRCAHIGCWMGIRHQSHHCVIVPQYQYQYRLFAVDMAWCCGGQMMASAGSLISSPQHQMQSRWCKGQ